MAFFALNMVVTALVISISAALAKRFPEAAGFVVSLPISTMLVLFLAKVEHGDEVDSSKFAASILGGIVISSLFLVPFVFAKRMGLGFAACYALGVVLLCGGYFVHRALF